MSCSCKSSGCTCDEAACALEAAAVERFGLTDRIECAGFILRDGRMIDFCEEGGDGFRSLDHGRISEVVPSHYYEAFIAEHPLSKLARDYLELSWFMSVTGAARNMPEGHGAEFVELPTPAQAKMLADAWWGKSNQRHYLDVWTSRDDVGGRMLSADIGPNPAARDIVVAVRRALREREASRGV